MPNLIRLRVVVAVITEGQQVLLSLRPEGKPYAGYWEFPGGKIDNHETEYAALQRELYEELGIEVSRAEKLFEQHYTYPDRLVHLCVWRVLEFSGEPRGLEGQELRWLAWDEMPKLRLLAANYAIIDELKHLLADKSL